MISNFLKKKSNLFFLSLLAMSALLEILFRISPRFSEFYCMKISPALRLIYAPLELVDFALSESILYIFSFLVITLLSGLIIHLVSRLFKKDFRFNSRLIFSVILKSCVIVIFLFSATFSASYHRLPIDQHMNLETANPTVEKLQLATSKVANELNSISLYFRYFPEQATASGMSFEDMSLEVRRAADKAAEKYNFLQKGGVRAKPIAASVPLTYTHIAGIYTFFTGEPCINTNYAEYTLPFTIAHEYSHQRGIGAENEADFTAFLILCESDNPYLRYSAMAEAFLILSNELYKTDREAYFDIVSSLPLIVTNDFSVASRSYSEYSDSQISKVTSELNDAYLKANGMQEGVMSYSQSVLLLIAYLNS
jgi:hypothetical protein